MCKYPVGGNKEDRDRLILVVVTEKKRDSGHKLKYSECHLNRKSCDHCKMIEH